jgi:hypothetical protein
MRRTMMSIALRRLTLLALVLGLWTVVPAMPSLATVLKWVANDVEGFAKPYNEVRWTPSAGQEPG